jgi:hypothetical protein
VKSEDLPFKRAEFFWLLVVSTAVLCMYRDAFSGFFMLDDFGWLVDSRFHTLGQFLRPFSQFNPARDYRPLSQETFFFIGQILFGMNPTGYHVLSFAFHLLGTLTLYFLLRQFFPALPSVAGTLFYGTHNAHLLSVHWISAVPEPMAAAFYILSLLFFVRFDRTGQIKFYAISWAAAILGVMSKESILSLPFAIALYCFFFSRSRWKWAAAYFVLPVLVTAFRLTSTVGASPYPLVFGKEALHNLSVYLTWMAGLSETLFRVQFHQDPRYIWLAAAFALALAGMVWLSGNYKAGIFSTIWIFLALQPVLYFSQHIYSYYLAPALFAVSFLITAAMSGPARKQRFLGTTAALALLCCVGWAAETSVKREGQWWKERSFLARDILKQMPEVERQLLPGQTALLFGFGDDEFAALQGDAAFKAYGIPLTRFILSPPGSHSAYFIESLKEANQLDDYRCFVYSKGILTDQTAQFRANPRAFYSTPPSQDGLSYRFVRDSGVGLESNRLEFVAGKDTLDLRVVNLRVRSIDLLYELNGRLMPPALDWRLDKHYGASAPVSALTPRGKYHVIGIRDSSTRALNRWFAVELRMLVR